ncbi:hypothetical protein VTN31DRAFT_6460 [Thermomyces dupontii]|uniref:uncharacterized protein n=1 Tax=Talaromyces thermophilus TaxID=28565 RepID=UPI0037423C11
MKVDEVLELVVASYMRRSIGPMALRGNETIHWSTADIAIWPCRHVEITHRHPMLLYQIKGMARILS